MTQFIQNGRDLVLGIGKMVLYLPEHLVFDQLDIVSDFIQRTSIVIHKLILHIFLLFGTKRLSNAEI